MTKTYHVESRHIKNGIPHSSNRCPVFLAIKETTHITRVGVITADIGMKTKILPSYVSDFIQKFDAGERVEPISFEL